jgi:hypothetical protein
MAAAWLTGVPLTAAVAAFQQSARQHILDSLLAGSVCGNPAMRAGAPEFLGHCAACWTAAGATGLGTLALMLVLMHAANLNPAPARR